MNTQYLFPVLLAFCELAVDFRVVILIFNLIWGIGIFCFPAFSTPLFIMLKIVLTRCCACITMRIPIYKLFEYICVFSDVYLN